MNRKTKNIKIKYKQTRFMQPENFLIMLFINNILKKGKKYLAKRIMQKTMFLIEQKFKANSIKILEQAICNAKIDFNLKSITSKSSIAKIPIELDMYRSYNVTIKNIINLTNYRSKFSLYEKLFTAIVETFYNKGLAVKKRQENLKIANTYKSNIEEEEENLSL